MYVRTLFPLSLLLTLSFASWGQQQVRLIDPSALLLNPDAANDASIRSGLQAAGVSDELQTRITSFSGQHLWPSGLATDSLRKANAGAIRNLFALHVCDFPTAEGPISVLELPMANNYHMNEELRARTDMFLFVRQSGWEVVEPEVVVEKPSKGPAWQRMKRAKILKPEEVYSTYDLAHDPDALELMERKGFSKAEVQAVVFRSHERNWPEAISQFESRYPKLPELKRYKAYAAGTWGDKVLVVIPAAENKKMREPLRPPMDIYMVFATNAVSVSEGKGRKR
jgi:hypothetical protein